MGQQIQTVRDYFLLSIIVDRQMSRRTRLKIRPKQRFSISHHSAYAASTSHFPRSYSSMGKDIQFPTRVLPLYAFDKICFVGTSVDEFFEVIQNTQIDYQSLKVVSISIKGQKCQQGSSLMSLLVFLISMCCFCLSYLANLSAFRRKYYPRYRFNDYVGLGRVIQTFGDVETLVINFQDNEISVEKVGVLEQAICHSRIRHVVLRNMSYFVDVEGVAGFFGRLRQRSGLKFAFVWEKTVLESDGSGGEVEAETTSLRDDLS